MLVLLNKKFQWTQKNELSIRRLESTRILYRVPKSCFFQAAWTIGACVCVCVICALVAVNGSQCCTFIPFLPFLHSIIQSLFDSFHACMHLCVYADPL